MPAHVKLLKVGDKDGRRVEIKVARLPDDKVRISTGHIPAVAIDKPAFAKNGSIRVIVERKAYLETLEKIEKYLEGLFLKELSDESVPASDGAGSNPGGNEESNPSEPKGKPEGEGDTASVPRSTRRKKPPASDRGGDTDS